MTYKIHYAFFLVAVMNPILKSQSTAQHSTLKELFIRVRKLLRASGCSQKGIVFL